MSPLSFLSSQWLLVQYCIGYWETFRGFYAGSSRTSSQIPQGNGSGIIRKLSPKTFSGLLSSTPWGVLFRCIYSTEDSSSNSLRFLDKLPRNLLKEILQHSNAFAFNNFHKDFSGHFAIFFWDDPQDFLYRFSNTLSSCFSRGFQRFL